MNKILKVEANYNSVTMNAGDILANAKGTQQIKLIRTFERKTTKTTASRVWVFAVLEANGLVVYNAQRTVEQLQNTFPVKVAA